MTPKTAATIMPLHRSVATNRGLRPRAHASNPAASRKRTPNARVNGNHNAACRSACAQGGSMATVWPGVSVSGGPVIKGTTTSPTIPWTVRKRPSDHGSARMISPAVGSEHPCALLKITSLQSNPT